MDIGFSLYDILMFVAAVQTVRYAIARQLLDHQAWAWSLYALTIGSWLYLMDCGLWLIFTDLVGHTKEFDVWFDHIMAFFNIPNLLIVELMIRARSQESSKRLLTTASVTMLCSALGDSHLGGSHE